MCFSSDVVGRDLKPFQPQIDTTCKQSSTAFEEESSSYAGEAASSFPIQPLKVVLPRLPT
ncbi:hypothetical protein OIDMADRAFT_19806 [Oidiodendron maius Zn]|uniref:Uncharacterized protein n=1 Tax=Oidiodendron maius (strain Zn) TaxID=913774 RepID=A0A0C3CLK0_OIDMZ|nr:hypothetical protein OIDMADRAFT_19806 [Oidiodendron maius Zn]